MRLKSVGIKDFKRFTRLNRAGSPRNGSPHHPRRAEWVRQVLIL